MGRASVRTLTQCQRHGTVLHITCRACGQVSYAAPDRRINIKLASAGLILGAAVIESIEPLMRCRCGAGRKGRAHKDARVKPLWPHEVLVIPGAFR